MQTDTASYNIVAHMLFGFLANNVESVCMGLNMHVKEPNKMAVALLHIQRS